MTKGTEFFSKKTDNLILTSDKDTNAPHYTWLAHNELKTPT